MSVGKLKLSYAATAQLALLPKSDRAALMALFSGDGLKRPEATKPIGDDRFVSRFGRKRVLWRNLSNDRTEILSIVDKSYANEVG